MTNLKYNCWGYKNGKPEWNVSVVAKNRSEAENLAWEKLRHLGRNPDKVTAK